MRSKSHSAADSGAGVACLYGNYAGDNMNVKMARRKADKEGIRVEAVIANAFAQPMADKLGRASELERANKSLILETIAGIQEAMNPKVLEQMLGTYLPPKKRVDQE